MGGVKTLGDEIKIVDQGVARTSKKASRKEGQIKTTGMEEYEGKVRLQQNA